MQTHKAQHSAPAKAPWASVSGRRTLTLFLLLSQDCRLARIWLSMACTQASRSSMLWASKCQVWPVLDTIMKSKFSSSEKCEDRHRWQMAALSYMHLYLLEIFHANSPAFTHTIYTYTHILYIHKHTQILGCIQLFPSNISHAHLQQMHTHKCKCKHTCTHTLIKGHAGKHKHVHSHIRTVMHACVHTLNVI